MNAKLLIDAVVRQTTVLVGHLATSAGLRAPLAHIASTVFLDLADELSAQGVSRKVQADMFGMALRTYHAKISRLSARQGDAHESIWMAVLDFIETGELVSQADVLGAFYDEDESVVRGVLRDLVDSGLVFQTGRGPSLSYRIASDADLEALSAHDGCEAAVPMVWLYVYLDGPVTVAQLADRMDVERAVAYDALEALVDEGRIRRKDEPEAARYVCDVCLIPTDAPAGWEAAFFDHFQAVVTAACVKLRQATLRSLPADVVGGSTYSSTSGRATRSQSALRGFLPGHVASCRRCAPKSTTTTQRTTPAATGAASPSTSANPSSRRMTTTARPLRERETTMNKWTLLIAPIALFVVSACSDEDTTGSESHWLACETDADCLDGQRCLAERCTVVDAGATRDADTAVWQTEASIHVGGYDRIFLSARRDDPQVCVGLTLVLPPPGLERYPDVTVEDGWGLEGVRATDCQNEPRPVDRPLAVTGTIAFDDTADPGSYTAPISLDLELTLDAPGLPDRVELVTDGITPQY